MKRSVPVLLKYVAIVGVSCFLAFVISQTIASADDINGEVGYASPGTYQIDSSLAVWRDASRNREVPVKIYFPLAAAAKNAAAKFPVIIFSHGLGGSREGGKRWAAHWASHGFVVVAMQHAGSDEGLRKSAAPKDAVKSMKAGMTMNNLGLRVGDVHFVIDEIIRRSEAVETAFANADPKRLGMSGHSFGAQTTLAVAGQKVGSIGGQSGLDVRITAAIAFSPNARNKNNLARQFGDISLPFFSITGSEDGSILADDTKAVDRRLPYENMPTGQKYLAIFDGGDHMVFAGHGFGQRRVETSRDKEIQQAVMAGTLAFWNAQFKQDVGARRWLDEGGFKSALDAKDIFERK